MYNFCDNLEKALGQKFDFNPKFEGCAYLSRSSEEIR